MTEDLLSKLQAKKKQKVKASFSLEKENFTIFRELCDSRGLGMSEVMDVALKNFLVSVGELEEEKT